MSCKCQELKLINNCYVIVDRYKDDGIYRYKLLICKEKKIENFQIKYRIINLTRGHICTCIFDSLEAVENDLLKNQEQGNLKILNVQY